MFGLLSNDLASRTGPDQGSTWSLVNEVAGNQTPLWRHQTGLPSETTADDSDRFSILLRHAIPCRFPT
jgi:hypothetical protein